MTDYSKIRCDKVERALNHRRLIERYLREHRPVSGGTGIAKAELGGGGIGSGLPGTGFIGPIVNNGTPPANISFTPGNGVADNDWFLPTQNGQSGTGPNFIESYCWKESNGYMASSVVFSRDTSHTSSAYAGQSPTTFALTADDIGQSGGAFSTLSPHEDLQLVTTASGQANVNPGSIQWRARALTYKLLTMSFIFGQPAQPTNPQTIRVQCTLSDGSANAQNLSITQTTGAARVWNLCTVSFQGGSGGCDLITRVFFNVEDVSTFNGLGLLFAGAWY